MKIPSKPLPLPYNTWSLLTANTSQISVAHFFYSLGQGPRGNTTSLAAIHDKLQRWIITGNAALSPRTMSNCVVASNSSCNLSQQAQYAAHALEGLLYIYLFFQTVAMLPWQYWNRLCWAHFCWVLLHLELLPPHRNTTFANLFPFPS